MTGLAVGPTLPAMFQVHATCIEVEGIGVLLQGPSGCGKSDLALRMIERGARLVADDRVDLDLEDGRVVASAPREIAGLLEVRGLGVLNLGCVPKTVLGLVLDLVPATETERIPEFAQWTYMGVSVPRLRLAPEGASAAMKVYLAVGIVSGKVTNVS